MSLNFPSFTFHYSAALKRLIHSTRLFCKFQCLLFVLINIDPIAGSTTVFSFGSFINLHCFSLDTFFTKKILLHLHIRGQLTILSVITMNEEIKKLSQLIIWS